MSELNLEILILDLLFSATRELRLIEIEEALWPIAQKHEPYLTKEGFHARVLRRLDRFVKYKWVQRRKVSHKNRRYSIRDKDYVRLILAANATGWDLKKNPKPLKLSIALSDKTYKEIVQSLSRILLEIVFQQKDFTQQAHTHIPGPLIFGFPIPISEEKGNILRDKILIFMPDRISADKIRTFTKEQYENFLQYLSSAWTMYFEESKITHNDIVISHFTKQQAERLREIAELEEINTIDNVVLLATLKYIDSRDVSKKHFEIRVEGSATKIAIEKGIYKNKKEAITDAIRRNEERLARELLERTEL